MVSRFLMNNCFTLEYLWSSVQGCLNDHSEAVVIIDDSVQDKRYSRFIELVKRQYSGNEGGLVDGIGLVNMGHSSGMGDDDFFPIDYWVY